MSDVRKKGKRGFASMSPARVSQIASQGGKAAHARGTAHEFTSDEARAAGQKGGKAVSANVAHMATIGRKGGRARVAAARARKAVDEPVTETEADIPAVNTFPPPPADN